MRAKVLIVDGYNVIRDPAGPYAALYADDQDVARERLIVDVASFAAGEWETTVVFDGGNNQYSDGVAQQVAGIDVVFSAYGSDADSVVERLATGARTAGSSVVVVSSDAQTQASVMGSGVARMSARVFIGELAGERTEWAESSRSGARRTTVAERLDPETRNRLDRLSRGNG